jgi:UDP-glucose 4-epimerase
MNILVTGGAGFIGSHVVDLLIERGYRVIVVDDLCRGQKNNVDRSAIFYEISLNSTNLGKIFEKERPEYVIHLASQVSVSDSVKSPLEDASINILGTIHLLDLCITHKVKKIIYTSTAAVYKENLSDIPLLETSDLKPSSFYGVSKLVAEEYIRFYEKFYDLPYTILRLSNVYGPRQNPTGESGVVSVFIDNLINSITPIVYGDGTQRRDFIYVKDVAEAIFKSLNLGENEVFNISSNTDTSINELYSILKAKFNHFYEPDYMPAKQGDIRFSRLDNRKALSKLKWSLIRDLDNGLTDTVYYFKKGRGNEYG